MNSTTCVLEPLEAVKTQSAPLDQGQNLWDKV